MKDIVIYCPCKSHTIDRTTFGGKQIKAKPKILFIASPTSIGEFKVQCSDGQACKKYNKERSNGKYNSWYKIVLNGLGGYSVEAIPRQEFPLQKVPVVIIGEEI